jgi:hypothetical protein
LVTIPHTLVARKPPAATPPAPQTDAMTEHLYRALNAVFRDLDPTGCPAPNVEPRAWQHWPSAESAMLRAEDGSGQGVWTDTAVSEADQLAMVAEQVQDWAVEELCRRRLPTNWPQCPQHPDNHPLNAAVRDGAAVWECPSTRRPVGRIGRLVDQT